MTAVIRLALVLSGIAGLGACATDINCEEPRPYQAATEGRRVVAPEGLDNPAEYKEIKIPDAAAKDGAAQKGCVDKPPRYFSE